MEEIKVYNTLTKEKEVFHPIKEGEAKIYVCGVTPYNHPHIGNARPAVTWDIIRRYLEFIGYKVIFVQNFTDVDDKIINKANAEGSDWKTISDRYIDAYFEVMDKLHVRRADMYPRVSDHMKDIIDMVKTLIEKGHAYVLGGDVYYDISTFKDYGKLSGRKIEDMLAGARIEVNDEKRNPGDFALWKAAKPGEPFWESPWGKGRPGWHIECSTMSLKYLGEKFDFHGGGSDLIFPHHENEIAQSQACIGDDHSFAQYWLHNGFITIHNEKMSKSKNNFFTVKDIHKEYPAMSTHYLGNTLDFHGGGSDLIFPHHENEIAQSEGCTCCHFVDYWLHNGFITINSEKMSKSLNNFFLVKDVLEKYSGDALRYFLLSTHYRSPLDFSDDRLEEAEKNMEKLKDVIARVKELSSAEGSAVTEASKALVDASDHAMAVFHEAMDDDFNTGLATGAMFEIAKAINVYYNEVHGGIAFDKAAFEKAGKTFKTILDILGILEKEWKKQEAYDDKDYNDLMDVILAVRQSARKAKQYQLADEIRDKLGDIGIVIEDTPTGARWKRRGV